MRINANVEQFKQEIATASGVYFGKEKFDALMNKAISPVERTELMRDPWFKSSPDVRRACASALAIRMKSFNRIPSMVRLCESYQRFKLSLPLYGNRECNRGR